MASCGKYEDGPKISLASKKARIINNWQYEEIYKNGNLQTLNSDDMNSSIEFKKNDEMTIITTAGSISSNYQGTWDLSSDKEYIDIQYTVSFLGLSSTYNMSYKILRLKSNELWLEYTDATNTIWEYHYKSK